MATISASGIGSGLDVDGIVGKLMNVEQRPLVALEKKQAGYRAQLSAYGKLRGALSAFGDAATALALPSRFNAFRAALADTTLATASASSGAARGAHSLEVQALAQAHAIHSAALPSTGTTFGSGTITIAFGSYASGTFVANAGRTPASITIPAGRASLAGVRDAINAAEAGVRASLVNDGTGQRLVLASTQTGAANALRITVADDDGNATDAAGLSRLAYDASPNATSRMTQSVAAQDAAAVIDGLRVTRPTNVMSDVLEGVSLTLTKAAPGTSTTITVDRDTGTARSAIEDFVKAYNDLEGTLDALGSYDAEKKAAGELLGDATLRAVQGGLRNILTSALETSAKGLASLADAGIRFERDGKLTIDGTKLAAVLADPAKDLSQLFAAVAQPTDPEVRFVSATSAVNAGRYAVNLTQAATRGTAVGSVAPPTTITAGANDALQATIDGRTVSVTLTAGTYTGASLAAEVQTRINAALGTGGPSVEVGYDGTVLTATSSRWGKESTLALTGGSALAALFGTPVTTDGLDVAGTLGGRPATGAGQRLSGSGLVVDVSGTATGARGEVRYALGFAARIDAFVDRMLAGDGALAARTGGIQRSIDGLDRDRGNVLRRLDAIETRLRAQFVALDATLASMTATSSYLQQQLASLAKLQPE